MVVHHTFLTSHKITYALRSCLYDKKIQYEPFWEIKDLLRVIKKRKITILS